MKIWTLTGGRRGNQVICEGIADTLVQLGEAELGGGGNITPMIITPPLLRRTRLARDYVCLFDKRISPPFPDIVLASGAATIAHARAIGKASKGKSFIAYLQDPHIAPHHFDFIWAPAHDKIEGDNVFKTLLTPHGLNKDTLTQAATQWRKKLIPDNLSGKIIGFSIGGKSRAYPFTQKDMQNITAQLTQLAEQGHYILTAPSRRTPSAYIDMLRQALAPYPHYIWQAQDDTDNPYPAILGLADVLIVSADSVNMIGEACTTGKPTYIAALSGGTAKMNRFHNSLKQAGYVQDFTGTLTAAPTPITPPENPSHMIAEKIYSAIQAENRL